MILVLCIPAGDAMKDLSKRCFLEKAGERELVEADYIQKRMRDVQDTDDVSEEQARMELLDKPLNWCRSRMECSLPPPIELAGSMLRWFQHWSLMVDDATAVPLFTPNAVKEIALQIIAAVEGHFSGEFAAVCSLSDVLNDSALHVYTCLAEHGKHTYTRACYMHQFALQKIT